LWWFFVLLQLPEVYSTDKTFWDRSQSTTET